MQSGDEKFMCFDKMRIDCFLLKNFVWGLSGVVVHCLVEKSSFYEYKGVERQVKVLFVNALSLTDSRKEIQSYEKQYNDGKVL